MERSLSENEEKYKRNEEFVLEWQMICALDEIKKLRRGNLFLKEQLSQSLEENERIIVGLNTQLEEKKIIEEVRD